MPVKDWIDILSKFSPATLVGGIGGYFARVLQTGSRRRRMRQHLYREVSNNYQNTVVRIALVTSVEGLRQGAALRFTEKLDLSFNVWNFYNDEKRREMLFELAEAEAIHRIYDKFIVIGNEGLSGYAHVRGKEAAAEVDDRLLDGTLDKKLYREVSSPEAWRYMDDLLNGKRESYRAFLNPI
jgi:hypothetical protein